MAKERCALLLVKLNEEQIGLAKLANGKRKQITHALLCGKHGQRFGTEQQCLKYYSVWKDIFPTVFHSAMKVKCHKIDDYETTFDLVNILFNAA